MSEPNNTFPFSGMEDSEELEARSQELKLRQKCMDIAALMMVEELEDGEEE